VRAGVADRANSRCTPSGPLWWTFADLPWCEPFDAQSLPSHPWLCCVQTNPISALPAANTAQYTYAQASLPGIQALGTPASPGPLTAFGAPVVPFAFPQAPPMMV
jgi:hypothetical protein